MVVTSIYQGPRIPPTANAPPDAPPRYEQIHLNYLTENIYAKEVENCVELVKRMGYTMNTQTARQIPVNAKQPDSYKEDMNKIKRWQCCI